MLNENQINKCITTNCAKMCWENGGGQVRVIQIKIAKQAKPGDAYL